VTEPTPGFAQLVDLRTEERPDAVAIDSVESGPHTWAELQDVGRRLARGFGALGVDAGHPVLTMLPADFENVALWAALARLRAVEVPVNHAYRGAWLRGIIDRIGARVAVIDSAFWSNWQPVLEGSALQTIVVTDPEAADVPASLRGPVLGELLASDPDRSAQQVSDASDLGIVMHTSGTTGLSKGVMLPWTALWFRINQRQAATARRGHQSVYYAPFGPFHWTGRGRWYEMAVAGNRLVTRNGFKTQHWLEDIRNKGCTITALVGAMPRFIDETPVHQNDADNPLEIVQMGPVLTTVDQFCERFGVTVTAAYSMTEIPYAFVTREPHVVSNETARSCGIPDPDVPIQVVSSDGQPVEAGELGELWVGGDRSHVNSGYYNMPAESEKAWEGGWFHTGDLFRHDDAGRYYFVDRAKDALRRRGENISSMEIEWVINGHPDVQESAVVGVPSEFGEDEVKAVVVARQGATPDPADLIAFIRPQIAEFAVPRYVEFVDELPKTATLRVQKMVLREAGVTPATWDRVAAERRGAVGDQARR
jgi:carnitine-CoA ligase